MRGSGAAIGLIAIPIAGLVLLVLKIFRIKHNFTFEEMSGEVVAWLIGEFCIGVLLYCVGIAIGIFRPLNQL
jgi:hypothetical protein